MSSFYLLESISKDQAETCLTGTPTHHLSPAPASFLGSTLLKLESDLIKYKGNHKKPWPWRVEQSLPNPFSKLCPSDSNSPAAKTEFYGNPPPLLAFLGHCGNNSCLKEIPSFACPLPLHTLSALAPCSAKKEERKIDRQTKRTLLGGAWVSKSTNKQSKGFLKLCPQ